ncbi:MAPK protein hog1 [Emmonsiellopsis sp. PD_33]|nr:MAPK protein hog1 [Emmonsiellopsis sp. PD_33]
MDQGTGAHRPINSSFDLTTRYKHLRVVKTVGLDIVCSATDDLLRNQVAIRKIPHAFKNSERCQRTYLELKLLKLLRHENIAALHDVFVSWREDIYLITEHQGMTLGHFLSSQRLEPRYTKVFFYQILTISVPTVTEGIEIPPLSSQNCDLQITHLEHARIQSEDVMPSMLYGGGNQCYHAPETMVGMQEYQPSLDMWAAGCIFAEMINGFPLFSEERCTNQLYAIIRLLGYLPADLIDGISTGNVTRYLKSLPVTQQSPLANHINTADPQALDLLEHLLDFDPDTRYRANQALLHDYVSFYHDPTDEPDSEQTWSVLDLDYVEWPVNDWKNLM